MVKNGPGVLGAAEGVELPIGVRGGQFLAEGDDVCRRDHGVVPAVIGRDLDLDGTDSRQARRGEQAMEAGHALKRRPGAGQVEHAEAAEAEADRG